MLLQLFIHFSLIFRDFSWFSRVFTSFDAFGSLRDTGGMAWGAHLLQCMLLRIFSSFFADFLWFFAILDDFHAFCRIRKLEGHGRDGLRCPCLSMYVISHFLFIFRWFFVIFRDFHAFSPVSTHSEAWETREGWPEVPVFFDVCYIVTSHFLFIFHWFSVILDDFHAFSMRMGMVQPIPAHFQHVSTRTGMIQPIPARFRRVSTWTGEGLNSPRLQHEQGGLNPTPFYLLFFQFGGGLIPRHTNNVVFINLKLYIYIIFAYYLTRCPATRAANPTRAARVRVITPGRVGYPKCYPDPTQHQEKLFLTWECLWSPGKLCEGLDIDRNLRKWWQMMKICFNAYLRKVDDYIIVISLYQLLSMNAI